MKKRVLIADDDWMFLQLLKFKLKKNGFEVITAKDEKEFWTHAFDSKPDLIMIDLLLKNKIGSEVYQTMIDFGLAPSVPVVFMSALVDQEEALILGEEKKTTYPVFSKLCDLQELINKITALLDEKTLCHVQEEN